MSSSGSTSRKRKTIFENDIPHKKRKMDPSSSSESSSDSSSESYYPISISKYFNFRKVDNWDFFRCLVILLAHNEKYIIDKDGAPWLFRPRDETFDDKFVNFVSSQYQQLSKDELIKMLMEARKILKTNGHRKKLTKFAGRRAMKGLPRELLRKELDKAKRIFNETGKI